MQYDYDDELEDPAVEEEKGHRRGKRDMTPGSNELDYNRDISSSPDVKTSPKGRSQKRIYFDDQRGAVQNLKLHAVQTTSTSGATNTGNRQYPPNALSAKPMPAKVLAH